MIKERVDKDYNSVLRTALTSISKVNKTDVETLRTALGVGFKLVSQGLLQQLPLLQSFADIGKATSDQLQNLPGFGQVKVKKIKDAFEKPFRHNATSSLSFVASQTSGQAKRSADPSMDLSKKGKGKEKLDTVPSTSQRPPREPSPVWDIESDPEDSPPGTAENISNPDLRSCAKPQVINKKRPPSPVWDIELDLTED